MLDHDLGGFVIDIIESINVECAAVQQLDKRAVHQFVHDEHHGRGNYDGTIDEYDDPWDDLYPGIDNLHGGGYDWATHNLAADLHELVDLFVHGAVNKLHLDPAESERLRSDLSRLLRDVRRAAQRGHADR